MVRITLPRFEFFSNSKKVDSEDKWKRKAGSPHTGSVGTDPLKGVIAVRNFNYRILLHKNLEGVTSFEAECWVRLPYDAKSGIGTEGYELKIFDGEESSLPQIEDWLNARYQTLMGNE